ncbi:MAG: hypothetical protein GC168_00155 [Candidatus Hydrogenedens sp.]|nr:hypothetical protein [Candidatus Hydrogenedens sp.]
MARFRLTEALDPARPVSWRVDAVLAAVVFLLAFALGTAYVATWGGVAMYWQEVFAPAVCVACGMEPANPYFDDVPELSDFLYQRSDTFDCDVLKRPDIRWIPFDPGDRSFEELQASHPLREFPGFIWWQHFHWYLLWTVAQCWRVFGVSWEALWPLFGFFYGLTAVAAYGLFRLAARPALSLAYTLLLVFSPLHLEQLPHLRDYGKAPFFLFALLAAGWLLKRGGGWARVLGVAAATGLLLGVGVGFRQDVTIALVAFAGSVAVFFPEPLRQSWARRAAVAAMCVAVFYAAGHPILSVLARQNNAPHDTLIGFQDYCHQRLGVGNPVYDFGDPFKDEHTRAAIERYAKDFQDSRGPLRHYSAHYDAMGRAYFMEIIRIFPADLVTRAFASVLRVLDELRPRNMLPEGWADSALSPVFQLRATAAQALDWGNRYTAVLAILLLAAMRPSWGFTALCLLYLYAGYPSLRFSTRHVFHLEFLPLWISALGIQCAWYGAWRVARGYTRHDGGNEELARGYARPTTVVWRVALVGLAGVVLTLGPWELLKRYQDGQVRQLLQQYDQAPRDRLVTASVPEPGGHTLIELPGFARRAQLTPEERSLPSNAYVLAIETTPGDAPLTLEFAFGFKDDHYDFTRTVTVPAAETATVYFPVYTTEDNVFLGVRVASRDAQRVGRMAALRDVSQIPILLTAVLPPDWAQSGLYLRFTR